MKKMLLGLSLTVLATAASAEWVLVDSNTRGDMYADTATKSRTGRIVRIWAAVDYLKPKVWNGKAYFSSRIYYQFDCGERTLQGLQITGFTGKMLTGEVAGSDNKPGDKSFSEPGTSGETLLNFACK